MLGSIDEDEVGDDIIARRSNQSRGLAEGASAVERARRVRADGDAADHVLTERVGVGAELL